MAKIISIDFSRFTHEEIDFPEACKFCLKEECDTCQFGPERKALIQELLEKDERTLEQYEAES